MTEQIHVQRQFQSRIRAKLRRDSVCRFYRFGDVYQLVLDFYFKKNLSSYAIAEKIKDDTTHVVSSRAISRWLKIATKKDPSYVLRSPSERFRNAIKVGRMNYDYMRNPSPVKRLTLSPKLRYQILERDGNKCVKCGATSATTQLQVDHIKSVRDNGPQRDPDNLQTLCKECNVGKRWAIDHPQPHLS